MKKLLLIVALTTIFAVSYSANVKSESLTAHNKYRTALGLTELTWSSSLGKNAQTWANYLAKYKKTSHSTNRKNVGENLAYGSSKSNSITKFVDGWAAEKEDFVEGENFPECTSTGDVDDVQHYTQIVWEKTTQVGCGSATSSGRMYYVCHYSPAGNINGQPVYTVEEQQQQEEAQDPQQEGEETSSSNPVTTEPTESESTGSESSESTDSTQDSFITDALAAHNNERTAYGVPSLTWSTTLAQSAKAYADTMAKTGTTSHSSGRVNVGENLAWGSGSRINTSYLAGLWLDEREYFISGKNFPDCSTTGSWSDVAHYTQMMWRKTTEVGCGMTQASSGRYYLVCHYSPQGNINGHAVY